jgi:hypothetical protein
VLCPRPGLGLAVEAVGDNRAVGFVAVGDSRAVAGNRAVVVDIQAAVVDTQAAVVDIRAAAEDIRAVEEDNQVAAEDNQVAEEDSQVGPRAYLVAGEGSHTRPLEWLVAGLGSHPCNPVLLRQDLRPAEQAVLGSSEVEWLYIFHGWQAVAPSAAAVEESSRRKAAGQVLGYMKDFRRPKPKQP